MCAFKLFKFLFNKKLSPKEQEELENEAEDKKRQLAETERINTLFEARAESAKKEFRMQEAYYFRIPVSIRNRVREQAKAAAAKGESETDAFTRILIQDYIKIPEVATYFDALNNPDKYLAKQKTEEEEYKRVAEGS